MKPLLGERDTIWVHRKELDEQQTVAISELMHCWRKHHELSRCIEWLLQCRGNTCTTLKVLAKVENINHPPDNVSRDMKFILEVSVKPVPEEVQDPLFSLIDGLGYDGMRNLLKLLKCEDLYPGQEDEREFWYKQLLHLSSESDIRNQVSAALEEMGVRMNRHIGDFFVHYNEKNIKRKFEKPPVQVTDIDKTRLKEPVLPVVQTPYVPNSVSTKSDSDHDEQTVPKQFIANSPNALTQMRDPVENSESTSNTQLKRGMTMITSNEGNTYASSISCANSLSS